MIYQSKQGNGRHNMAKSENQRPTRNSLANGSNNKSTKFFVDESDDSHIKLQSIGNEARLSARSKSPRGSNRAINSGPAVRKGKKAVMDGVG